MLVFQYLMTVKFLMCICQRVFSLVYFIGFYAPYIVLLNAGWFDRHSRLDILDMLVYILHDFGAVL